ncbi:MAG TPA: hypothetical protein VNK43_08345 [Gemmatimonadales bacterium]|nr:hypothetical protein [Gemmatimonadales bacterium]
MIPTPMPRRSIAGPAAYRAWPAVLALAALGCGEATAPAADAADTGSTPEVVVAQLTGRGTDLGTLGGAASFAHDVNDQGVVVGVSQTAAGLSRAFRWTASTGMAELGTLPGDLQSTAVRILNSGKILGTSTSATGVVTPVIWTAAGEIVPLAIPRGPGLDGALPVDFNDKGDVVGRGVDDEGVGHGWYWSEATGRIDLRAEIPSCSENEASAINARGDVAGTYCRADIGWLHAFVWRFGRGYRDLGIVGDDVPNANVSGLAITDAGIVAGWIDPHGNTAPVGYLWTAGRGFTLLPNLPGGVSFGHAQGVNGRGVAVGASFDPGANAFLPVAWPSPSAIVRLDGGTPHPGVALAVNDRGAVVGWHRVNGSPRAMLWQLEPNQTASVATVAAAAARARRAVPVTPVTGAESCLGDRAVLRSKAALFRCAVERM